MAKAASITEISGKMFDLLEPLSSEDRHKCMTATMVFLGEEPSIVGFTRTGNSQIPRGGEVDEQSSTNSTYTGDNRELGDKLKRWMVNHKLDNTCLDHVFHIEDDLVELIADSVPGRAKKEKTINCYLLVGIKNLIQNDEPKFNDKEALEFCQRTLSYDKNNHTTNRQSLSNRVSGERSTGFTLTVPGLRDAAKLIKEMSECKE